MTPIDAALAIAGKLAVSIERRAGGSRRATWGLAVGLVSVSAITTLIIGSSQRPTDLTFEDVRLVRIPAMTSWVRLEGELRIRTDAFGEHDELHDTRDDSLYVIVTSPVPLAAGHTVVTGQLSAGGSPPSNIGSIDADFPAVPKANEPFGLILLPAAFGIVVALGIRLGYPIVRRDRAARPDAVPLRPGERLPARWSGRVASEAVGRDGMPCSIALDPASGLSDLSDLSIAEAHRTLTVRLRRAAPFRQVRVCRVTGCKPGLELHSATADVLLVFGDRAARARLAASLH